MIIKLLKKELLFHKIKKLNKKEFSNKKNKSKSVILVEFNSFHVLHIIFSYIVNFFKNNYNYQIKGFYSHILLSYSIHRTFKQKILSYFGQLFRFGFFGIYKSFGVDEIFFPKIDKIIKKKSEIFFNLIYKKIKNKKDILKIKADKILIGDLIYDSYLTRNRKQKPTIDINSQDFKEFLMDFILLFYSWKKFFSNNDVKVIASSHSCYTMGIPVRLALKNKILALEVKENRLKKFNFLDHSHYSETKHYPKIFKKFTLKEKNLFLNLADNKLQKRFKGNTEDLPYVTTSSFNNKDSSIKIFPKTKNKKRILILPHDFVDAPHIAGDFVFADMYEWIKYLAEQSNKLKNYEWYLKTHPKMDDKYEWYQNFTRKNINLLIKNSRIKLLPPNTPHNQIINSGIDAMLTVFGTTGHEYAYKRIPVINASKLNPHAAYRFNIHTNKIQEYSKFLENIKNLKINIKKKEVLEFYYMHFIFQSSDWFFEDYKKMLSKLGNYHDQWTTKIYINWVNDFDSNFKEKFYKKFSLFLNSKDQIFSNKHSDI
jgi:hypothetical protein